MSDAPIQKGTIILLGYNGYTYSLILTDDATIMPIADVSTVNDENNTTTSVQIYNPGQHLDMSGVIKGADFPSILLVGGAITVNAVTWRLEKYEIRLARTEAKLSFSAIKEDSMSYT